VIYFLAADRIARAVIYQTIIIGEMLLYSARSPSSSARKSPNA
jgi:hypothetical protein